MAPRKSADHKQHAEPVDFLPLPHLAFHVLLALAECDRHGWAIIKKIQEMTAGQTDPSSGSLYLSMAKLEERKLIEQTTREPSPVEDDERRKYYRLTRLGQRVLTAEAERVASLVEFAKEWKVLGSRSMASPPKRSGPGQ